MWARLGLTLVVVAGAGCGLPLDGAGPADGSDGESFDASLEGEAPPGDGSTGPREGGAADARGQDDALAPPDGPPESMGTGNGCPVGRGGPAMFPVGDAGYCIDSTEVDNAQYAAFLAAMPAASLVPAACGGNAGFAPTADWPYPAGADGLPVVWVNWCDAYAFCAWAGKRLCGRIGGGSNPTTALADPAQSQWFSACSAGGSLTYPYGNAYEATACYGGQPMGAPLVAVASYAACVGGYSGIFDMSGSVWEWEDSCSADVSLGDFCQIRGGSLVADQTALACAFNDIAGRGNATPDRGFRCCAP